MNQYEHYRMFVTKHPDNCYTYNWFVQCLDYLWDMLEMRKANKTDWLGFEQCLRDICKAKLTDDQRVALLRGFVGAFTGRGAE